MEQKSTDATRQLNIDFSTMTTLLEDVSDSLEHVRRPPHKI
jgi:hypothetical protein